MEETNSLNLAVDAINELSANCDFCKPFEYYYRNQNIVSPEEWGDFLKALQSRLPVTFRVVQRTMHCDKMNRYLKEMAPILEDFFRSSTTETREELYLPKEQQIPVKCGFLGWYPNQIAYQLGPTKYLKSSEDPRIRAFNEFLLYHTQAGLIYRQEAVSMLPPLFLNITKDSCILDLCAAPGSKTSQILEELHHLSANELHMEEHPTTLSKGAVIANDANSRRSHLLIHNLRHLHSPSLLVTNHAAQRYPSLYDTSAQTFVRYDGVLCDVPCTADGTLRKSPAIRFRWHPHQATGTHRLQLQILKR
ncbi:NOL1/NOP2/sun family protein [Cardiosporidium cionae]|uniref:NOL1/NOP2/sun family protein n=1 Tax=Cardiosporidium cionae TaxID=476202 RepID=A0ABQ7J8D0_9APIC|nr:NOL1/NOP2/sun family protein [Cardiosporidium cionae]|eukprot:KAF8820251.1 NOL1/NOP2/sun family protein [Cardiosporidium cionae]